MSLHGEEAVGRAVSEQEGTMICNLLLKYGTQFKCMALDYKLNPFQLTPAQLQKKVANYLRFERAAFISVTKAGAPWNASSVW